MVVDEVKLNEFIGRAVGEWGAIESALLTFIGDKLGLYKAMTGAGALTPEELAKKTGTHPRMMRVACCSSCWRFCYLQPWCRFICAP
jgi:hypothetical protein